MATQKVLNIILIVSISLNIYFIAFNKPKTQDSSIYQEKVDSAMSDIETYKNKVQFYEGIIDSLKVSISEKPKNTIIYIRRRNNESKKIDSLDSLSRVDYLDSIFSNRGFR